MFQRMFYFKLMFTMNVFFPYTGTNVAYRIQIGDRLLAGLDVVQGSVPQNITLSSEAVRQLGPGCHKLTLHASNSVTFPDVSSPQQVNQ